MKITREELDRSEEEPALELFLQGIRSKASKKKYTQTLRRILCEIFEDVLEGDFESRTNQLVKHAKENLVLIEKYDGSIACVKPETKTRLMEKGWTSYTIEANQNTIPEITKNQIIDIVRSDMVERVENPKRIDFYPDAPSNNKETYLGLYYIDGEGIPFKVNNFDFTIAECKTLEVLVCGALNPSIIDAITGKLVYDIEVTYHNDDGSLTTFYYVVDAKNGQIIYDGQNLR